MNLKCVGEYAKEAGKRVGLVTNQPITHASPAPLYAHSPDRNWESDWNLSTEAKASGCKDIAAQFVDIGNHIDVFLFSSKL